MRYLSLSLLVLLGLVGFIVFVHYALIDWDSLQQAYQHFASVVSTKPNLETLFVAEAQQNIHRINLFADGTWTLLSAIIVSIGVHGLALIANKYK